MFREGGSWEKKCHATQVRSESFPTSRVSLLGLMKDPRRSSYQMSYVTPTVRNRGSRMGQMIKWATIILLIRTLFIECFLCARSHTKSSPFFVPFVLTDPVVGTVTIPISQMRRVRFRDVNSLAHREMDPGCHVGQTNSCAQRRSHVKDRTRTGPTGAMEMG